MYTQAKDSHNNFKQSVPPSCVKYEGNSGAVACRPGPGRAPFLSSALHSTGRSLDILTEQLRGQDCKGHVFAKRHPGDYLENF